MGVGAVIVVVVQPSDDTHVRKARDLGLNVYANDGATGRFEAVGMSLRRRGLPLGSVTCQGITMRLHAEDTHFTWNSLDYEQ